MPTAGRSKGHYKDSGGARLFMARVRFAPAAAAVA